MSTADGALHEFCAQHGAAIGFWMAAGTTGWFRVDADGLSALDPLVTVPDDAYLVRAFNPRAELRWETHPGTPEPLTVTLVPSESEAPAAARLLWGTVTAVLGNGWVELHEGRVGSLSVPLSDPAATPRIGAQLILTALERRRTDEHGNVTIAGERLLAVRTLGD